MQVVTLCGRIYSGLKGQVMKAARYTAYSTLAGFPRAESQVCPRADASLPARRLMRKGINMSRRFQMKATCNKNTNNKIAASRKLAKPTADFSVPKLPYSIHSHLSFLSVSWDRNKGR